MSFSVQDIHNKLKTTAALDDRDIDPADIALLMAACDHPGISLDRYRNHLEKLTRQTGERFDALIDAGADDNVETQLAALKHVMVDTENYEGTAGGAPRHDDYDLMRVIDRRRGADIALALLYISAARHCLWRCDLLELPGYFALRLDYEGRRVIFSPQEGCRVLDAAAMRQIVKDTLGPQAELSAAYYEPLANRQTLVAYGNAVKLYHIEHEDYEHALKVVEMMRFLAPEEYRLLLDAGVLYARTGQPQKAVPALEDYISRSPHPRDRQEAAVLLEHIRAENGL